MAGNILSIDYGSVRVGLALASSDSKRAEPYRTVSAGPDLMHQLQKIIVDESIEQVVVGLPRNLDGDDTAQTGRVRQFAADLAELTGLGVALQDEALTSQEAARQLSNEGRKHVPKELIDQVAAAIILQDYLDSL